MPTRIAAIEATEQMLLGRRAVESQRNRTAIRDTVDDDGADEPVPPIEHQLAQRMRVRVLLCDIAKAFSPQEIVTRKIHAIDAMTALAIREDPQTRKLPTLSFSLVVSLFEQRIKANMGNQPSEQKTDKKLAD
jgi:hypothetical protein